MKVTIFGKGVVGEAMGNALSVRKGHEVNFIDPPKGIEGSSYHSDLILVCVPTPFDPSNKEFGFDSIPIMQCLSNCPENARVVIKSTVPPGTTYALQQAFPRLHLFFSPEFLTEATAVHDAMYPARQVVGFGGATRSKMAESVLAALPDAPWERVCWSTEAEMIKYFSNAFYAVKVAFANQMFDLCHAVRHEGVDYEDVREAAEHDPMIHPNHLDVHHGDYRGFGGKCLPKDLNTLIHTMQRLGLGGDSVMIAARDYNDTLRKLRETHKPLINLASMPGPSQKGDTMNQNKDVKLIDQPYDGEGGKVVVPQQPAGTHIHFQEPRAPGSGGDVVFSSLTIQPGKKWDGDTTGVAVDGSIIFKRADGEETFRLDPNGDVAIRGDVVTKDLAMYECFAEWLAEANVNYDSKRGASAGPSDPDAS